MILHDLDSVGFFSSVLSSSESCCVCTLSLFLSVQTDDVIRLSVYMSLMLFNYVVEILGAHLGNVWSLK